MGLDNLLTAAWTGQTAAKDLHESLRKELSKRDQGLTTTQQKQAFVERLKAYSDSIGNNDQIINEYLKEFDPNYKPPNNPRPDTANLNERLPSDATGTANPFFSPSPMATFVKAFMSIMKMQGYLAKMQNEIGLNNMRSTLEIGKDQAFSILQQAKVEAESLEKQATMDFAMAGVSFTSAAGNVFGSLSKTAKDAKDIDRAEEAIRDTNKSLDSAKNLQNNKKALDDIPAESRQIDKEIAAFKREVDLKKKLPPGQVAITKEEKPEELQELLEGSQKQRTKLDAEIAQADIEKKALEKKVSSKNDELDLAKNDKAAQSEIDKIQGELDEAVKDQKNLQNKLTVAKSQRDAASIDETYAELQLAKKQVPPDANKIQQAEQTLDDKIGDFHNNYDQPYTSDMDNLTPGEKAEVLNQQDRVFKTNTKIQTDDDAKLTILERRQSMVTEKEGLLKSEEVRLKEEFGEDQTKLRDKLQNRLKEKYKHAEEGSKDYERFEQKMKAVDDDFKKHTTLLEENPTKLEETMKKKMDGEEQYLDALKRRVFSDPIHQAKMETFRDLMAMANHIISAKKSLIDAEGKLNASTWESRKSMDATYLQMMQQAMMTMLDASKNSIEVGGQSSQTLMSLSDKQMNTAHWAV